MERWRLAASAKHRGVPSRGTPDPPLAGSALVIFIIPSVTLFSQNPLTFVTQLANTRSEKREGCVTIPITDPEATAHYSLAYLKKNERQLRDVLEQAVTAAKNW